MKLPIVLYSLRIISFEDPARISLSFFVSVWLTLGCLCMSILLSPAFFSSLLVSGWHLAALPRGSYYLLVLFSSLAKASSWLLKVRIYIFHSFSFPYYWHKAPSLANFCCMSPAFYDFNHCARVMLWSAYCMCVILYLPFPPVLLQHAFIQWC